MKKTIIKDSYPIIPPREVEYIWFVECKPRDTWKLKI